MSRFIEHYPNYGEFQNKMTLQKVFTDTDELLYNILVANFGDNGLRWLNPEPKVAYYYYINKQKYDREKSIYDQTLDSLYNEKSTDSIKNLDAASNPSEDNYLTSGVEQERVLIDNSAEAIDKFLALDTPEDKFINRMSIINGQANISAKVDRPIIDLSATFKDGKTTTKQIDLSIEDEGTVLRSEGPTYIFGNDGYITTETGVKLTSLVFDDTDKDKVAGIEFIAQDGGKAKVNNIEIWDSNETDYNLKSVTVNKGITLGGVFKDAWPTGGGGDVDLTPYLKKTELQTEGSTYFSNKVNYDHEEGSKAILNATAAGEMEFKVGELSSPSFLFEKDKINMLNGQIQKVMPAVNLTDLVNKKETIEIVTEAITNAGIGKWETTAENDALLETVQVPDENDSSIKVDTVVIDDPNSKPNDPRSLFYSLDGTAVEISYNDAVFNIPASHAGELVKFKLKLDVTKDIYQKWTGGTNTIYKTIDILAVLEEGYEIDINTSISEKAANKTTGEIEIVKDISLKDVKAYIRKGGAGWYLSLVNEYKEDGKSAFWSDRELYFQKVDVLDVASVDVSNFVNKREEFPSQPGYFAVNSNLTGSTDKYVTNHTTEIQNKDGTIRYGTLDLIHDLTDNSTSARVSNYNGGSVKVLNKLDLTTKEYVDGKVVKLTEDIERLKLILGEKW